MGQTSGVSADDASRVVREALEQGINLIDTAEGYDDSEVRLGQALQGISRDDFILATKFSYLDGSSSEPATNRPLVPPSALKEKVEGSLRRLGLDYVDIYQAHGVTPERYDEVVEQHVPALKRLQDEGKIRHIGITESGSTDKTHEVIKRVAQDGHFDTAMVTYNMINQNAERTVFGPCEKNGVGIIIMMAVRRALSRPERLVEVIADLKARGLIDAESVPDEDPLGWLVRGDVESVPAAAYRYAIEPSAVSTVLTGSANLQHLRYNLRSVDAGPLPVAVRRRLQKIFGHLDEGLGN